MAFGPGNNANPHGRPRTEKSFTAMLRRILDQEDSQRLREAAEQVMTLAAKGEPWAIQMLADRLDGKPAQGVIVSGDDASPPVAVKATVEFIRATIDPNVADPGST